MWEGGAVRKWRNSSKRGSNYDSLVVGQVGFDLASTLVVKRSRPDKNHCTRCYPSTEPPRGATGWSSHSTVGFAALPVGVNFCSVAMSNNRLRGAGPLLAAPRNKTRSVLVSRQMPLWCLTVTFAARNLRISRVLDCIRGRPTHSNSI